MSYPGSKAQAGVFQRIIGQMPPHEVYVEPFFGSGQVFWRKRRAPSTIAIDLDKACIARPGAEAGVRAICGDALEILPQLGPLLRPDALVYCDPPYLLSTRKERVYYLHEMSDEEHARLLALLQGFKFRVLLSGYPSPLYGAALRTWRCLSYRTRTRGRTVTECLWANFPEPDELHDWRYAGRTFRQRLSYKRLAGRWLAKLERMPARKRNFLLDAISQRHVRQWGPGCQDAASVPAFRSGAPELALVATAAAIA